MHAPAQLLLPQQGTKVGEYEIVMPLKAGGMATLFLGRKLGPGGFERHVAIKVIHPHLATDKSFVDMFLDEARLSAAIRHPNVVHVESLGEEHGYYYLVMEFVHGCTLGQLLRALAQQGRQLAPEFAAAIAMRVADGLHAAHETKDAQGNNLGVVHRDVSPQNILLGYDGHIKLIDFGIAKAKGRTNQSMSGSLKGKIRYMPPEQAWGREVDRRADIYALGVILWECLTFQRMFEGDNDFLVLEAVRHPNPVAPSTLAPGISEGLDRAVLSALAPEATDRFETAQAFRRAIGNGSPDAGEVEAEDIAAVLHAVMKDEIDRFNDSLPATLLEAPKKPPSSDPMTEVEQLTRITRKLDVFDDMAPAPPVTLAFTASMPPTSLPPARTTPSPPPRSGARIALALGISAVALAAVAFVVFGRGSPREPPRTIELDRPATGDTTGHPDNYLPSCGSGPGTPDERWRFVPESSAEYTIHLDSTYDGLLAVYEADADESIFCNDDYLGSYRASEVIAPLEGGHPYDIVVDGYSGAAGTYELSIRRSGAAP